MCFSDRWMIEYNLIFDSYWKQRVISKATETQLLIASVKWFSNGSLEMIW